jgi:CAAX protease family protein
MFSSQVMHWDFALILIFLITAVPWLGRRRIRQLLQSPETSKTDRLRLYASTIASQWIIAGVILWRSVARGISPASLGVAIPHLYLTLGVAALLASLIFANQVASLRLLAHRPSEAQGILPRIALRIFPQDSTERLAFFAVVVTVATCEEIIYRGFAQHVLASAAGDMLAAGVLGSAVMFSLAHAYQGRRGLASTFLVGLVFAVARAWTGSLLAPLVGHFVADLTVGLMAPARVRRALVALESAQTRSVTNTG